jgi:hypothetical protein
LHSRMIATNSLLRRPGWEPRRACEPTRGGIRSCPTIYRTSGSAPADDQRGGGLYRFLMKQLPAVRDRSFVFGFSRGAFKRAGAGRTDQVHRLLFAGHEQLLRNARDVFENMETRHRKAARSDREVDDELAREFRTIFTSRRCRRCLPWVAGDTVKAWGIFSPRKGLPPMFGTTIRLDNRAACGLDRREKKRPPFQVTDGAGPRLVSKPSPRREFMTDDTRSMVLGDHSYGGWCSRWTTLYWRKAPFDWILGEAIDAGLKC